MYYLNKKEKIITNNEQETNRNEFNKTINFLKTKNNNSFTNFNQKIKFLSVKKEKKYNSHLYYIYSYLINFIFLEYILLSLPKIVISLANYKITLTLGEIGDQQIFNDNYDISLNYPSRVYVNGEIQILRGKNVLIEVPDKSVVLEWNEPYEDLSYMFANLTSITKATITASPGIDTINISYMFYNCTNLKGFSFTGNSINKNINATGLLYNCKSLLSANFTYRKNFVNINMSYMFRNCEKLSYISFPFLININDMRGTFYNCNSLSTINFKNFKSVESINTSYLFYNCYNLNNFTNNTMNIIKTNDMQYMFYNCLQLNEINLTNLEITENTNLSYAFYNCEILNNIILDTEHVSKPSDMQNMFYSCSSLNVITFPHFESYPNINMTRMFYNCYNIQTITFGTNSSFYPNDLHATFYNCKALLSLDLSNKFITDNTYDISYLFYNCVKLSTLELNFSNLLTKNMRGTFQNCKALTNLDISNFHTAKAEIMWDMFKGCSSMQSLDLSSFDTSKVTDMESMFEDCSQLTTLSLNSFQTPNVQYMNKMFKNCNALESLDFRTITSTSCGTMHQMFYNCKALKYLNLYNITERGQSIAEIFDGASKDFTFCIKEKENVPNIFNILYNMNTTKRDCEVSCYGQNRIEITDKKLCCEFVKYGDNCYNKCPGKTHVTNENDKVCKDFNCTDPYYYNYEQDDCTKNISGHYVNDSISRTIDKCHENCTECKGAPTNVTTNCKECKPNLIIYRGNCYDYCRPNKYINGKCKCFEEKCNECSESSLEYDLCQTCNIEDRYFQKEGEIYNVSWINCYKDPDNYYLSGDVYKPCYQSCRKCAGNGDRYSHNCKNCTDESSFGIPIKNTHDPILYNCYPNCTYYYYFNDSQEYHCTTSNECPPDFSNLINGTRECIKNCTETEDTKYEFRKVCYEFCPSISGYNNTITDYFCKISCPFDFPFEMVEQQICVSNCTIMERHLKKCRTNFFGDEKKELLVQDKLYENLKDDIIDTFDYHYINDNFSIVLSEKNNTYEIVTTRKMNNPNITMNNSNSRIVLGKCETRLKDYYGIPHNESLYILKLDAERDGVQNTIVQFLIYYPLDKENLDKLEQLDLTLCEGDEIEIYFPSNMTPEEAILYDMYGDYFNDICYQYTSEDGTDIPLEIRQKLYKDNNQSQCQNGCDFKGVAYQSVRCKCTAEASQPLVSEIKVDQDMLYKFVDIKNIINFQVLKCYRLLIILKVLVKNIGFYVYIPTFILYIICLFIFYKKEFEIIKKDIYDIVEALKKLKLLLDQGKFEDDLMPIDYKHPSILKVFRFKGMKVSNRLLSKKGEEQPTKNIQNNIQINININNDKKKRNRENTIIKEETIDENNNIYSKRNKEKLNSIRTKPEKKNAPPFKNGKPFMKEKINLSGKNFSMRNNLMETKNNNNLLRYNNRLNFNLGDIDIIDKIKSHMVTQEEKEFIKRVLRYNDTELNMLSYRDAIKYDHRNFLSFYISVLKTKHIILSILDKRDYNSRIIKIFLFSFSFSTCYGVNALFFDDDTMHDIYYQKGEYNFIDQAPQIIYSFILSYIMDNLFNFLALSEEEALNLKHEKIISRLDRMKIEIINSYQTKFIAFFILSFILLMFFWYYIACFCAVYANTQFHLLTDTLISFGTSLLTPFAIYIFAPVFRIIALRSKSKTNEMIYSLSKMITFF